MNSKNVSEPTGEQMTLFSPVGSLNFASHTPLQENDLEKKMTATSGRKCLESFERFDRNGFWARTYSALLIGQGGWFSKRCNLTWKLKAMKYKRMYFQLAPSTPRTGGTGFGLLPMLPTPTTAELNADRGSVEYSKRRLENPNRQNHLAHLAKTGLLPTPRASKISGTDREDFTPSLPGLMNKGLLPTPQAIDGNGQGRDLRLKKDCNRDPEQPGSWRGDLKDFAVKGMLPTPKTQDSRHALKDRGKSNLGEEMSQWGQDNGIGSQLNPLFVAEMMGFLPNHTVLPYQKIETTWTEI